MSLQVLTGIYYAYPVCLSAALLISHLILFRRHQHEPLIWKQPSRFGLIWYLQAALSLALTASVVVVALLAAHNSDNAFRFSLLQAQLASCIGTLLYFGAGLLPDPDGPFEPTRSNFHAWIVAIIFEIVFVVFPTAAPVASISHDGRLCSAQVALGIFRLFILTIMSLAFRMNSTNLGGSECNSDSEREALIAQRDVTESNDNLKKQKAVTTDAQSTGWLDYFVGFAKLLPYIWPSDSRKQQGVMIFCFALLLGQRIINILVPYQLGVLVDSLGTGRRPYSAIALYCIYKGLQGQQGVIGSFRAILWIPISQSLYKRLSCAAFEHVLSLSLDFHLSKRIGEVMAALSKGGALNTFLDGFAFQLFPMVFDLGVAALYLFIYFDAFYSIIVLGVMWSYIFVTIYMAKYRGRARREMAVRDREMDANKTDAMMAYETVQHNSAVPSEVFKFRTLVEAFQKAEFSVLLSLNALNAIQNFIFMFGIILVCLLSAYQISLGLHKVPDFVTLITYFAQLHQPLAFFGSFYNQVQNNLVDAERMLDLFNKQPEVVDGPEAIPIKDCGGHIELRNVNFGYGTGKRTLTDITFEVKPGTTTAIVGESGSGKSTILKLLFRFYDIDSGSFLIDGIDSRHITIESLRHHIGVVPQDTILFNDSIMYNLLYSRPDATREEVYEACRAASIHQRICNFPAGYETRVGERGLKLSGGEKQRVAIARAILRNPKIMLLDEATASLDTHTEKQVQEALENVTKGRSTITIAHRLSTITHADEILVLHEGRIVQRGRHETLINQNGRYRSMWEKQTTTRKRTTNCD